MGGRKGSRGGSKARSNGLSIDFGVFEDYAERLDELGADLKDIFQDVMEQEAETVQEDTLNAVRASFLPAHGKYSYGDTRETVDMHPRVNWEGSRAEVGLGFDKSMAGAGGFLITGTPKMTPDRELERIFVRKTYVKEMYTSIQEYFEGKISEYMGG